VFICSFSFQCSGTIHESTHRLFPRCERIRETLERLGLNSALNGRLQVQIRPADSRKPNSWWDGRAFDAILADVPCSASGVVRREADIAGFAQTQATILEALWPLLRDQNTCVTDSSMTTACREQLSINTAVWFCRVQPMKV
jgi:hypothetical protein